MSNTLTSKIVLELELDNNVFGIDGLSDMDRVMSAVLDRIQTLLKKNSIQIARSSYTRADDVDVQYHGIHNTNR